MQREHRGFTLIELMMTCVLVAILASIAIPSYRSYIVRAQRTDATTALLKIQTAQEKLYLERGRYSGNLTNPPSDPDDPGLGLTGTSEHGYYTLTADPDDLGYTATATPTPGSRQATDTRCARFTVDHNGVRRAYDSGDADRTDECWR